MWIQKGTNFSTKINSCTKRASKIEDELNTLLTCLPFSDVVPLEKSSPPVFCGQNCFLLPMTFFLAVKLTGEHDYFPFQFGKWNWCKCPLLHRNKKVLLLCIYLSQIGVREEEHVLSLSYELSQIDIAAPLDWREEKHASALLCSVRNRGEVNGRFIFYRRRQRRSPRTTTTTTTSDGRSLFFLSLRSLLHR